MIGKIAALIIGFLIGTLFGWQILQRLLEYLVSVL
jgi:hypothetical protein